MDFQSLRFFVAAAETGSFSGAAEATNYAQSNLSGRMKQLEDELGEKLFYRNRRGVSLTAKGMLFYDYAVRLLKLSDDAVSVIQNMDHPQGRLHIGSIEATALGDLPPLLSAYHRANPDVQLSVQTELNEFFLPQVLKSALDGAFVAGPVSHPDIRQVFFKTERLVVVGSADHRHLELDEILDRQPLITFPDNGSIFRKRFELLLSSRSVSYVDRLTEQNSLGAMIAGISAGIGFGYLPHSIVSQYVDSRIMCEFPFDDPYSNLQIEFIYRKDHVMDAAFRNFLELLQK